MTTFVLVVCVRENSMTIPTCAGPDNQEKYKPVVSGKYRDLKYEQGNDVGEAKSASATT